MRPHDFAEKESKSKGEKVMNLFSVPMTCGTTLNHLFDSQQVKLLTKR